MSIDVAVYLLRGNGRSQKIGEHMAEGIRRAGDNPIVRDDGQYKEPREAVAVFYGYEQNMPRILRDYAQSGRKAVFIDLGYWGRRQGGRYCGFHKISINARHPTAYFQTPRHDMGRVAQFNLQPKPYRRNGSYVLIAGMSDRAAKSIGMAPGEWERNAISEIAKHTDRPIVYRPKPSWRGAVPIEGAGWSSRNHSLEDALDGAWAVVTHHSNVAVDGLIEGIPAFCWDGVATPLALQDLARIEAPIYPERRGQWLADISYCQWNTAEMQNGVAWTHLKREGLVP